MIDVHCHLQFKAFENDYDQVIKDAFEEGITTIINTGTQISSSKKAVEFAEKYERLFAIVGVHPHHADKIATDPYVVEKGENAYTIESKGEQSHKTITDNEDLWLEELEKLTKHPKVLAIGEIGMDYFEYKSNGIVEPKLQKEIFIKQIELAHQVGLPLQIHNRHAGEDVIKTLKENRHLLQANPGMFHCFAGTKEVLNDALDLGFSIGFDGNSTYKGLAPGETVELSELARLTPLDRIVIETDAPYLTPIPHRGKRNEPKYAILTARFIAACKGVTYEELVEQTDKNVYTMFTRLKK
ncbi:MAG TPA: TatD family hydrolase [Candidatus Saccharimonadales bacterium]|nr:TatD family hydrolase [Candidatus Saccharimonadales bacterium]